MNIPRFQNTWNAGNVISLAVMLLGGVGIYTEVRTTMTALTRDLNSITERVTKLETAVHVTLPVAMQRNTDTLIDIRIAQAQQRALLDSINSRVNIINDDVQTLKRAATGK